MKRETKHENTTFLVSLLLVTCLALLPACADQDESTGAGTAKTNAELDPNPEQANVTSQEQTGAGTGKLLLTPSELGLPAELAPLLKAEVDEFARDHRKGTLMGNILINRYLKDTGWVQNVLDPTEWGRFNDTVELFKKYSTQYEFDYLMLAALGYQESRLDQSMRSQAGAIGIMQILSSTATDPNVAIPDIEEAEHNIHAGVKYLNSPRNRYFTNPEIDTLNRALFSFAAYNAGPARVRGLMQKATSAGLDPNKWFNNVELIAAKEIGRETVDYVSNIYKYYFACSTIIERERRRSGSTGT